MGITALNDQYRSFLVSGFKGSNWGTHCKKKKEGKNVGSYLKTSEKIWLFFSNLIKVSNLGELTL